MALAAGSSPFAVALTFCHRHREVKPSADVNSVDKHGNTPLHIAAEGGDPIIVQFLINNGASVDMVSKEVLLDTLTRDTSGKNDSVGSLDELEISFLESRL